MNSRLQDLPFLSKFPSTIDSAHFNAIRLGLLRLGSPLRLKMAGLRSLEMILENDAWICVDNDLNELPVIAWTNFVIAKREALNAPVQCDIAFYHAHAGILMQRLLDITQSELATRMQQREGSY